MWGSCKILKQKSVEGLFLAKIPDGVGAEGSHRVAGYDEEDGEEAEARRDQERDGGQGNMSREVLGPVLAQ